MVGCSRMRTGVKGLCRTAGSYGFPERTLRLAAGESGFGLLLVLLAMAAMVLTLGAAIDFSHLFLVRGELQAITDEAALAAARELDGNAGSGARARHTARQSLDEAVSGWLALGADRTAGVEVSFGSGAEGPWRDEQALRDGDAFVRIVTRADARLFFLPLAPWAPSYQAVAVAAVAGPAASRKGMRLYR